MKILYYDCFAGISGDMNLAAMIDLGVKEDYLKEELSKLNLAGFTIQVKKDQRHGITGTRVDVILDENEKHPHRKLSDIEEIIDKSDLNSDIKSLSKEIFRQLAIAESNVHEKAIDEIHFHEVGAVDAIVDIVGAAICINDLKVDKVIASPVELGGGFVTCAHGTLPVPAPATVEILKGIPVKTGAAAFETTTPTGAAIISVLAEEFKDDLTVKIDKIAYGIGHKESDEIPNVLRVYIGELNVENGSTEVLLECNIDDMNPEWYDYLMEELFLKGAKEVFFTPVIMKKSRPAVKVSVLSAAENISDLKMILYTQTTTLGIRSYLVQKDTLERKFVQIDTEWGEVTIKVSFYRGDVLHRKPEYEDCKRIARDHNLSLKEVYERINTLIINSDKLD